MSGPDFFARRFDGTGANTFEFRDARVDNHVADLSYNLAPGWTLKSLTAFVSTDGTITTPPAQVLDRYDLRAGSDFSQDVRLVFDPPGSPLSGVIGVFAGRFSNNTDSRIAYFGTVYQDSTFTNETRSIAAYTDLRYRFLERWSIIAGGRLLQDKVSNKVTGMSVFAANEDVSTSNSVFLPKAGLAYDITPDQTVAATVNRGYRSGFAELPIGATTVNQVAPEFLWSYEVAYRSRWFDNRLQVNANIFYYDYSNQQIVVDNPLSPIPNSTFTQNAGKSHVYGGEIEARALVMEGLNLFTSIGLLQTKFDEGVVAEFGTLNGKKFPESPTVTASFGGIYKHHTGFFAAGDISYTNGYYSAGNVGNDPLRFVGSFTLVNARVGYEHKHGSITLFAAQPVRRALPDQHCAGLQRGHHRRWPHDRDSGHRTVVTSEGCPGALTEHAAGYVGLASAPRLGEPRERVWKRLGNLPQRVLIPVNEGRITPVNEERGFDHIAPRSIGIERHLNLIGVSAECVFEECRGANTIFDLSTRCSEHQFCCVGRGLPRCHGYLSARNSNRLKHQAGRRLPKPVTHLFVERDVFFPRVDVNMVSETIK